MRVRRRFLDVGGRRVHYFRAGEGPPAVLIHSSPANARLLMKEIERLADAFTVFAFDTPGFGLSDPLPPGELSVADLADALDETLAAIGMPRCPMFGTHTGAAIALEFGTRHPERLTGLVLDGVPSFTDAESAVLFDEYFRVLPISDLGGHYSDTWTRFRDQSIWFPWCTREPGTLNGYDLGPPHSTHLWVQMFFEAAEHYAPAYRAASFYGSRAIEATAELTVPAAFTATETDMLYPHLARLPIKQGQEIVPIGTSFERKRALIAERFARWPAEGAAPADRDMIGSSGRVARQFVDGAAGVIHLRHAGDRAAPALLLLHDAPGSAEQAQSLIAALADRFFVVAPDLPGHGESDAFAGCPTIDDFVDAATGLLDQLGLETVLAYGIGFGSSATLALAERHPARVRALAIEALALPDAAERAALRSAFAPPIAIEADGSHWYRTWLMLRDSKVYWPWYDRRLAALRRVPADFSARPLHRWTMDVMRGRESYGHLIHAALDHDAAATLDRIAVPLMRIVGNRSPLAAYDARFADLSGDAPVADTDAADLADRLARHDRAASPLP